MTLSTDTTFDSSAPSPSSMMDVKMPGSPNATTRGGRRRRTGRRGKSARMRKTNGMNKNAGKRKTGRRRKSRMRYD